MGTTSKPVTCTALLDYSVDGQLTVVLANHVSLEATVAHTGLKDFFAWIFRHCISMHRRPEAIFIRPREQNILHCPSYPAGSAAYITQRRKKVGHIMNAGLPKDSWDKMQAAAALIASVFVPLAVAFVGSSYSNAMKDAENRLRYVELAIGILRAEPNRDTLALRGWAVEVLSSQSSVPLSDEAKSQLKASALASKFLIFQYKGPNSGSTADLFEVPASPPKAPEASPGTSK